MCRTMIETQPSILASNQFISVPAGWADAEWNALIAHDEVAVSLWVDHKDSPAVRAVLAAIPRRVVGRADPEGDPVGPIYGSFEAGRWCIQGAGPGHRFVTFDRSDLDEALYELANITEGEGWSFAVLSDLGNGCVQ